MTATKRCTACQQEKTLDQFYVSKTNGKANPKPVIKAKCKPCVSAEMVRWSKANPEKNALTKFVYNLRTRYGMTLEQYQEMLTKQDGKCAICEAAEETKLGPNGTIVRMSV